MRFTSTLETKFPEALFIVAGSFNQANLKCVMPKYHRHISCPTRGPNILDHCYITIKDDCRSISCPHFGKPDHSTVFLLFAYKQKLKRENPSQKEGQCWSKAVGDHLWDCLESVDWTVFKCSVKNLDGYATTDMDCISTCVEDCMPKKSIQVFTNQKLWMIQEVHSLLKTRHAAFKSGDPDQYKKSRYDFCKAIRDAKRHGTVMPASTAPDTLVPSITASDVRLVFLGVNPRNATGPGSVPCADQLTEIFTDIFKHTLLQAGVLTCFKKTTIIPIPKKACAMRLRKFGMSIRFLTNFYRRTIESILSGFIMAWYGNYSAYNHKKIQKVMCTAQTTTEANLLFMDSIYIDCCHRNLANIIKDPLQS
eukprot:g45501.t1